MSFVSFNYLTLLLTVSLMIIGATSYACIQKNNISASESEMLQLVSEVEKLKISHGKGLDPGEVDLGFSPIQFGSFLEFIFAAIPSSIYLAQVSASILKDRVLSLSGFSNSIQDVIALKSALMRDSRFISVDLLYMNDLKSGRGFEFELLGKLK